MHMCNKHRTRGLHRPGPWVAPRCRGLAVGQGYTSVVGFRNVQRALVRVDEEGARRVAEAHRLLVEGLPQALDGDDAQRVLRHRHKPLRALLRGKPCSSRTSPSHLNVLQVFKTCLCVTMLNGTRHIRSVSATLSMQLCAPIETGLRAGRGPCGAQTCSVVQGLVGEGGQVVAAHSGVAEPGAGGEGQHGAHPPHGRRQQLGGRVPRKRVRVSLSCPVTRSTSVRSSTPLASPAAHPNQASG